MDTETLERLLMDQALGELPPDAEALLAAYLADRPTERIAGAGIERMVAAAKAALAEGEHARVPAFPADVLRRRSSLHRRWAIVGRIASLAACVLIGVAIHLAWTAGGSRSTDHPVPTTFAKGGQSVLPERMAVEAERPGFWSARQWYERAGRRQPESGRRVIWDSPLAAPRLGDAT